MSLGGYLPKAFSLPRPTRLRSQKADAHDFGGIFQSLLPGGDVLTEMEFQGQPGADSEHRSLQVLREGNASCRLSPLLV